MHCCAFEHLLRSASLSYLASGVVDISCRCEPDSSSSSISKLKAPFFTLHMVSIPGRQANKKNTSLGCMMILFFAKSLGCKPSLCASLSTFLDAKVSNNYLFFLRLSLAAALRPPPLAYITFFLFLLPPNPQTLPTTLPSPPFSHRGGRPPCGMGGGIL